MEREEIARAIVTDAVALQPRTRAARVLLATWRAARGGEGTVQRHALRPERFAPALGHVAVLAPLDGAADGDGAWAIRLFGTETEAHFELGSVRGSTAGLPPVLRAVFEAVAVAAARSAAPVLLHLPLRDAGGLRLHEALGLPVAEDAGQPGLVYVLLKAEEG